MTRASSTVRSSTATLAAHVLGLRIDTIPHEVRLHTNHLIMDAVGAGLYGRGTRAGDIVHAEASTRFRPGKAVVWGRTEGLDAAGAALVNGTQTHAFELDDYHPPAKIHPSAVIVPAALAVVDERTTGDELIAAVVAAHDVMARVSLAAEPKSARRRGWHLTGVTGPFGATAVVGRLLRLDEAALTHAFGIASSCSSGLFAFSREGTMTKCLHAGRAAESGVTAARLAARGFTGPSEALDADDGSLLGAISDAGEPLHLTENLGRRFEAMRVAVKPYPCCGSNHSSIDAVLELRREYEIDPNDVAEVVAGNSSVVVRQCGFPYRGAGDTLEAQMSLQYCLAAALIDGSVSVRQFDAGRRRDPALRGLAGRVRVEVDPVIDAIYPSQFPARVAIRTRGGNILERRVSNPLGSPERPLSGRHIKEKFCDVTAGQIDHRTQERLVGMFERLHTTPKASQLVSYLSVAGTSYSDVHGELHAGA